MGKKVIENELSIFVKWMEFLKWFLPVLEKMPKKVRFTVTNRMENMALDIVELLVEAKYTREKIHLLKRANLCLEKIRVLLRISHEMKYFSGRTYRFACDQINEVGAMLGGWVKQQQSRR